MDTCLGKSRKESIESLEFVYFLQDLFFPLLEKYQDSRNPLIIRFVKIFGIFYSSEARNVDDYNQLLIDSIFWQSRIFYYETMQNFVVGELNALKFAQKFSNQLLAEKAKANSLVKDFQKQVDIELNPKSFEFSKIILRFEFSLDTYQAELKEVELGKLSENDLSLSENSLKEDVKSALEEVNKYLKD